MKRLLSGEVCGTEFSVVLIPPGLGRPRIELWRDGAVSPKYTLSDAEVGELVACLIASLRSELDEPVSDT
jgi:hypothetical protein